MENKQKLIEFIKNGNKNKFCQNPKKWMINNGFSEFLYLIKDKITIKSNLLEFAYGIPLCTYCKTPHKRILGMGWKLGWCKTCSEKCRQKLASERQKGSKNICHKMSLEKKINSSKKQSITLKNKILQGLYTPKTENYHLFGTIDFMLNGSKKSVRSLWEMIYWLKNPNLEYEKIRIQYFDNDLKQNKIYITDFYDKATNTIIEIKPKKYQYTLKYKQKATIDQGYNYIIIDDDYFNSIKDQSLIEEIKKCCLNYNKIKKRLKWLKKK